MKLTVSTPTAVIEDVDDLRIVRAEDDTGSFGIQPGHADFVTVLPVSVVSWTAADGREGFVLVRRGVMTMSEGARLDVAARDAYRDDELQNLGKTANELLRQTDEMEDVSRTSDTRIHLATIRQVEKVLRDARGPMPSEPPRLQSVGPTPDETINQ
jgi:F-type H+-transporting ATPase subunit epsilon